MAKAILGLEIGSSNIKLLEYRKKRQHYIIDKSSMLQTPRGAIVDGQIRDGQQISQILKEEIKNKGYRARDLAMVIESSQIITRDIRLEKMSAKDLKTILELQYHEYLLIDRSHYQVTYKLMGQIEKDGMTQQEVLLVAAPKQMICSLIQIADYLKLNIKAINIVSDAVANLFHPQSFIMNMTEQEAMVLDIGAKSTTITLISAGLGFLKKDLAFGLEEIIGADLKASLEQQLGPEIRRLLQFHLPRRGQEAIEKIYLIGGGADIEKIDYYLSQILDIPCVAGLSLDISQIDANPQVKDKGPYFANLLGLISGL